MPKTVTLRLDDATYELFKAYAASDNRPLANLIETAAKRHLQECDAVSEAEMREIMEDAGLRDRLRKGSRDAGSRRGRFVE